MALLMNTGSNSLEQDICPLISDYLMIFLNSFQHKRTRGISSIYHKIILFGLFAFYYGPLCSPQSNVTY